MSTRRLRLVLLLAVAGSFSLQACGDSGTDPHAPPTLTSLSAVKGVTGTTVTVTLAGTNFVKGETTVAVSGAGVIVTEVSVTSGRALTVTFVIDAAATLGSRSVTVTTSGGTSAPLDFTVNPPVPTLSSLDNRRALARETVTRTLTGANFVPGATTVDVTGSGVAVDGITVTGPTSLSATFAVAATAALGDHVITVSTPGGTSGGLVFTVYPQPPFVADVSPSSATPGATVTVTISGSNFITSSMCLTSVCSLGTTLVVGGAGVTTTLLGLNSTSYIAQFKIAPDAAPGARTLTVKTSGGTAMTPLGTVPTFTVTP